MWQAMDVGDGGAGRETAEWVNVLLAAFWSILQPIVSRYFWKSRWQPVMTRQYYTICYLQGGQRWCGAIGSRTFKVCEVLASDSTLPKAVANSHAALRTDFILMCHLSPATVLPAVELKSLQGIPCEGFSYPKHWHRRHAAKVENVSSKITFAPQGYRCDSEAGRA